MTDLELMQLALAEARKGLGQTSPNPAVGAVIARDGVVLSRGYHRAAGKPHAEIEALNALPDAAMARGADIYVTLEPCSTFGRTGPCTEAIAAAGLKRVFVGAVDPNPAHAGRGLDLLRAQGIEVHAGLLAEECTELNEAWNHFIQHRRPWVIAKAALSLDGSFVRPPGEGQWLTSAAAREHAHRTLRARVDAIVIGAETLRRDNPQLTVRGIQGARQPRRIVLTRGSGSLPTESHIFTDKHKDRTQIITDPALDLNLFLTQLAWDAKDGPVTSVLLEGGARLITEFLRADLVNAVQFYYAPLLCGGELTLGRLPASLALHRVRHQDLGEGNFVITALVG